MLFKRCVHNFVGNLSTGAPSPLLASAKPAIKEQISPLARQLVDSIKVSGPISTAQFMRQALTHPTEGYYMKSDVFGAKGDFITSPEISQMFGELIGVWFVAQWKQMGSPQKFNLVELGPGRGTLMWDMMRTVTQFKEFTKAINSVNMIEASPFLRNEQSKLLIGEPLSAVDGTIVEQRKSESTEGFQIHWHDDIETVEKGIPIFLVAHEFFDAMPIYQFQMANNGWREIMIDVDTSPSSSFNFRFILSPGPTKATVALLHDPRYKQFKEGSRVEVSPDCYTFAHKIGRRLKDDGGLALIADYGKNIIMSDTLRGIKNHKFISPLSHPGEIDLTADVDFSFLRKAFEDTGIVAHKLLNQGDFLRAMGIAQRLQVLLKVADADKRKDLASSYERLVSPSGVNGMGEIYNFMAVTRENDPTPYPFSRG